MTEAGLTAASVRRALQAICRYDVPADPIDRRAVRGPRESDSDRFDLDEGSWHQRPENRHFVGDLFGLICLFLIFAVEVAAAFGPAHGSLLSAL